MRSSRVFQSSAARICASLALLVTALMETGCPHITQGPPGNGSGPGNPYYMTAQYSCVEAANPNVSDGDCTITQYGPSCQQAKQALLDDVASRGDVCVHCTTTITDPTKKWDGNPPAWVQGGPCSGQSMVPGLSPDGVFSSIARRTMSSGSTRRYRIVLTRYAAGTDVPKVIEIPGADYAPSITSVRNDLASASSKQTSYPISSILKKLPIDPKNVGGVAQLIKRGKLSFTGNTVQNDGKPLDIKLQDERVGSVELSVPSHIAASVSRSANRLTFTFPQPPVVILQGLADKYQIASNERLDSLDIRPEAVEYAFHSSSDSNDKITLTIRLADAGAMHTPAKPTQK